MNFKSTSPRLVERYDVIIVGAGPSGLTAALYTARRGLSVLVLSQDIGGQAATTGTVENYPGFDLIDGYELMTKFRTQAEKYGATIILDEVMKLEKISDGFIISTATNSYQSPALILAQGLTHKHLDVPGEKKFIGRGVSYCATCDAPLYKDRPTVIVGGGNSAMDAALLLAHYSPQVTIINHNAEFRGEKVLIERMNAQPTIRQLLNTETKEILGDDNISGVKIQRDGVEEVVPAAGVFVEIGFTVNPALMKALTTLDGRNQIIVNTTTNGTSVPGLFAAGDVTTIANKQIVISAGEGAKAALGVHQYLQSAGLIKRSGTVDWGVSTPMRHLDSPS